jgi:type II secretory pathway pseudopilin PulG
VASSKITESTAVSLGVVVALIGGVLWLGSINAQGQANSRAIEELKERQEAYLHTLQSIDSRLSHIEGSLGDKR